MAALVLGKEGWLFYVQNHSEGRRRGERKRGEEEGRGRGAPLDICDEKAEKKERRKKGKEMKEKETSSTTTLEL